MEKDTFVAASSVRVDFVAPGDYMHIDVASVESLELVRPLQPAGGGFANKNEGSLCGCVLRAAPRVFTRWCASYCATIECPDFAV